MNPCQMLWSPRKSRDKGFCWSLFTVTKGRMAKLLLRIIICLILCVFSVKAQAQASHKWTHQGNVWVVTMDHSTSMRSVLCSPERLTQALRRCGFDYAHDYFLLVLAGVDRIGEGDFGGQLLHICIVAIIKQGYGEAGLVRLFSALYGENDYNTQRAQRVFNQAQKINLV